VSEEKKVSMEGKVGLTYVLHDRFHTAAWPLQEDQRLLQHLPLQYVDTAD
jgi:hypothetical protein